MARRLAAILFDFDHTLTDFGDHVAWTEARPAVRALYLEAGVAEVFLDSHFGSLTLYGAVAEHQPLEASRLREVQGRASAVLDRFERAALERTRALPGAHALVEALPSLGMRTGIVTSNSAGVARAILERLGLDGPFEVLVGRDDVRRLKPDPEGLITACAKLGVLPSAAAYVGDMPGDVRAAHAAGMQAWAVGTGLGTHDELREAGADAQFATLNDVLARLNEPDPVTARPA
jgi:HAD superfamily hydrolase (TIGR01509 family)